MGETAVDKGEGIRDVVIRLFGTSSKSISDLIANQIHLDTTKILTSMILQQISGSDVSLP